MSDVFEFAVRKPQLTLGADRTQTSVIDITSRLGRHEPVTVEVDVGEGADRSWFTVAPADLSLQDGETTSVTVSIAVPPQVPAGRYDFTLRAYAVSDPQNDFTRSQVSTVEIVPVEKSGIPSWLLIVLAVLAVLLVGGIIWFVFLRGGGSGVDNVIAQPVPEAIATLENQFEVSVFPPARATDSGSCVLLQTPEAGRETSAVALLATDCPVRAPVVVVPEFDNLCAGDTFGFCQAVDRDFPGGPSNTDFLAASFGMRSEFVEAFTISGADTPNVIGLSQIQARQAILDAGLEFREEADGVGLTGCVVDGQNVGLPVLLQHPFGGVPTGEGSVVSLVLTSCPAEQQSADAVQIASLVDLNTFANLPVAVPNFARALLADPNLGAAFIGSSDATEIFKNMEAQFRQRFAVPRVPSLVTLTLDQATALTDGVGLELVAVQGGVVGGNATFLQCPVERVVTQDVAPGTRVADLNPPRVTVGTQVTLELCRFLQAEIVSEALFENLLQAEPDE